MRESTIEAYLRDRVRELGGKAYKFVSPGNDGMPDRLTVIPPNGKMFFVETKAPGKEPTPLQRNKHRELRAMGCLVFGKVDSKWDVDVALKIATGQLIPSVQDIEELEMQDVG